MDPLGDPGGSQCGQPFAPSGLLAKVEAVACAWTGQPTPQTHRS